MAIPLGAAFGKVCVNRITAKGGKGKGCNKLRSRSREYYFHFGSGFYKITNKNGGFVSCDRPANSEDNFLSAEVAHRGEINSRLVLLLSESVTHPADIL